MRALSELRSLPNLLSVSRLAMAAAFALVPHTETRVVLVMAALATDYLDGFIARRVGPMTRLGALLDPLADRVFMLVAISVMLFAGALTTAGYFVMLIRDLMTAIGFLVARIVPSLRAVVFMARMPGKIVTVFQLATLMVVLVRPSAATPLLLVVGVTSLWAVADYTIALYRARTR